MPENRIAVGMPVTTRHPPRRSVGWRIRHPIFGVCDLPEGPFLPTALRREYTLLRHALPPPQLDSMHNNPVTRGLVNSPEDWPWSSWRFYYLGDASILRMDRMGRVQLLSSPCGRSQTPNGRSLRQPANGGRIEVAQRMAGHSNAKTTGLYDRCNDDISVGEVERIGI